MKILLSTELLIEWSSCSQLEITLLDIYNVLFAIKDLVFFLSFHAEKLLELLREDLSFHNRRTVVFCNTTPSCDFLGHYLTNSGISHIKLHSTIAIEVEELGSSLSILLAQTYPVGMGLQTFHRGWASRPTQWGSGHTLPTPTSRGVNADLAMGMGMQTYISGFGDMPSLNQV